MVPLGSRLDVKGGFGAIYWVGPFNMIPRLAYGDTLVRENQALRSRWNSEEQQNRRNRDLYDTFTCTVILLLIGH